jgi:hypothetical protein
MLRLAKYAMQHHAAELNILEIKLQYREAMAKRMAHHASKYAKCAIMSEL